MPTRLIIKGLAKTATEKRLYDHCAPFGEVTDCRLKYTKDGQFRNFAFVGFRTEEEGSEAIRQLNGTYFDTGKLVVEAAHAQGAEGAARPWSRYSTGSSAHDKLARELLAPKDDVAGEGPAKGDDKVCAPTKTVKLVARKTRKTVTKRGSAETEQAAKRVARKTRKKTVTKQASAETEEAADTAKIEETTRGVDDAPTEQASAGVAAIEDLDLTGRLYITNLPYGATEEEFRSYFEKLGEVSEAFICKDEDTSKSRGMGYVTYVFPENAIRAMADFGGQAFQGRKLHLAPARAKRALPEPGKTAGSSAKSSFKRRRQEQRTQEAQQMHTWNLLYVSSNAALDAASQQLGVSKSELVGRDAEHAAVTAALTETSIIQQTKRWLKEEGIRVDCFRQSGPALSQCKLIMSEAEMQRRDDTIIVKHLPARASAGELRERFGRHGELLKCTLAPSGTVAIVQYADKESARRAFTKLAFRSYKTVPLMLEWAPESTFAPGAEGRADEAREQVGGSVGSTAAVAANLAPAEGDAEAGVEEGGRGFLYVKNLNFSTTEAGLRSAFGGCAGFRSAVVMRKRPAIKPGNKAVETGLSMGYGFIEFSTPADATEGLKSRQGMVLDGHTLELRRSNRSSQGVARKGKAKTHAKVGIMSTRICVRNLAFEATKKELRQLFGAYGSVSAVRIPKKSDYSGHRGFGFIDFASKAEAAAALDALQHTHLYGRRLVLEPAEETAEMPCHAGMIVPT